jgi:predicted nucleic acid-binding protein
MTLRLRKRGSSRSLRRSSTGRPRYARGTASASPDAIHLATAIHDGADVFLTGDAAFARCSEIVVDVLSPAAVP